MKMELILEKVCMQYGYSVPEVMTASRAHLGKVKTCIYCALRMAGFSCQQVAKFMKKDWTTIAHVSRKASDYELCEAARALTELGLPVYRMRLQPQAMSKMTKQELEEYKLPHCEYLVAKKVPNYAEGKTEIIWESKRVQKA